ncbi:MAG: cytochrome-c peroxidase [Polyangiaceae bacterium]
MRNLLLSLCGAAAVLAVACGGKTESSSGSTGSTASAGASSATAAASASAASKKEPDASKLSLIKALPASWDVKDAKALDKKIELGRMLYFETRLSKNQDVSCNSCHKLDSFGVDGQPTSSGHKKQLGGRNSPTVYNAAAHFVQFWDGRAADVEAQAKGPILNPVEMAMPSEAKVVEVLKSIPEYVKAFEAAFPEEKDAVTYNNLAIAIGAFERRLSTPSKFDKYLAGDKSALNEAEKEGLSLFLETGCTACHIGSTVGGTMYQKAGLVVPWPNQKDQGRFEVTKKDEDKMRFKVPSLRNIEKTAPYFHDGSVASLDEAVKMMAKHQLGKDLKPEEITSIVTFLKTLTGDVPKEYIQAPKLPASTAKTPKADPS